MAEQWLEGYVGGLRKKDAKFGEEVFVGRHGVMPVASCPQPAPRPVLADNARPLRAADTPRNIAPAAAPPKSAMDSANSRFGMCEHRIFGQGKIIAEIPPDKYRVNFPGFGLKVIIKAYVKLL